MSEDKIDVIEIFNSIQGEGMFVGTPMTFIRLKNCNLRCEFCDTRPWEKLSSKLTIDQIIGSAQGQQDGGLLPNVCITGGEPLLEPLLGDLLWALSEKKCDIHIESNGSPEVWKDELDDSWPTITSITVSPKTPEWSLERMYESKLHYRVTDIKILVDEKGPKYPLEQFTDWMGGVYLQPVERYNGQPYDVKSMYALVKPWLDKYPFCILSLQLHKLIGIR